MSTFDINPNTPRFELSKPGNGFSVIPNFPLLGSPAIVSDFYVSPPKVNLDLLVKKATAELADDLIIFSIPMNEEQISNNPTDWTIEELVKAKDGVANNVKTKLVQDGYSARIAEVSKKLRSSNIDHSLKYLLSKETIYILCLSHAIYYEGVTDTDGIFGRVLKAVEQTVRKYINKRVAEKMVDEQHLDIFDDEAKKTKILNEIGESTFSYLEGKVEPAINNIISKFTSFGRLFELVDQFFNKPTAEIQKDRGTKQVKDHMVHYLLDIGVTIPTSYNITPGSTKYDEYLALAYTNAIKGLSTTDDPVTNVFSTSTAPDSFNYVVDYFETAEEQGIEVENILAAGTLYYIKTLADDLGMLRVADSIIMKWTGGMLDIPQGETSTKLYRYYKLRDERTTADERAMFYKIVLNTGEGKVLGNTSVNRDFPQLWDTLMQEVVKYIDKFEKKDSAFDVVSKSGIFQAIKDLQYNLTIHTSGMVKAILPEMYKQLEHAVSILEDDNVENQLGRGFRRSMWNVIERISIEDFNYMPNVSALRTSAVKGHKIFTTIASFNESLISDEEFRDFTENVESFIIAQSQLGEGGQTGDDSFDVEDIEEEEELDGFDEDEFDF